MVGELQWADLSRLGRGFLSDLRSFWALVVEAPDLIYAALGPRMDGDQAQDNAILRVLRAMIAMVFWIIYFPIVALNLAVLIPFLLFALQTNVMGWNAGFDSAADFALRADANFWVPLYAGLTLIPMGLMALRRGASKYFRTLTVWVFCLLGAVSAIGIGNYLGYLDGSLPKGATSIDHRVNSLIDYTRLFGAGLFFSWVTVRMAMIGFLLATPLLILFFAKRWRSILVANAGLFMLGFFWLALITTGWLVVIDAVLDFETHEQLRQSISRGLRGVGLAWINVFVMMGIAGLSLLRHRLAGGDPTRVTGRRFPRLIVPPLVLAFPVVAILLSLGLSWSVSCYDPLMGDILGAHCTMVQMDALTQISQIFGKFALQADGFVIEFAPLLLALGGVLVPLTNHGLDTASDIVNYFRTRGCHRYSSPLASVGTAVVYRPGSHAPLRAEVSRRLKTVMASLEETTAADERIVVVSHSLGTMIALEAAGLFGKADWRFDRPVDLVTMGCPYTSIFHYYYPHLFPAPGPNNTTGLRSWTNIYREDDYVGTSVRTKGLRLAEFKQPARGHLGYFEDADVTPLIVKLIDGV